MTKGGTSKELDKLIDKELEEWARAEMRTQNVQIDVFYLDAQLKALMRMLIDEEIIDQGKLNTKFKRTVLENLQQARAELEPLVREARLRSQIELPR